MSGRYHSAAAPQNREPRRRIFGVDCSLRARWAIEAPVEQSIAAYPWNRLPRASRGETRLNHAERTLLRALQLSRAPRIVAELLAAELEGYGIRSRRVLHRPKRPALAALLSFAAAEVTIGCEPELMSFLLTRLLDRAQHVDAATTPLGPGLTGAFHALVLEASRRLCTGEPPRIDTSTGQSVVEEALELEAWCRLDGRSYTLRLLVSGDTISDPSGDVPVSMPLVAAETVVARDALRGMRRGDAWLLGEGWFRSPDGKRKAIAATPSGELGFALELSNSITYLGLSRLPHEPMPKEPNSMDPKDTHPEQPTQEMAVMDAPVVVRVEVGSITLNAREWMALRAGDVLSCGAPPNSPVVLRAAGTELARAELVTVDGELGVRITQIVSTDAAPPDGASPPTPVAKSR